MNVFAIGLVGDAFGHLYVYVAFASFVPNHSRFDHTIVQFIGSVKPDLIRLLAGLALRSRSLELACIRLCYPSCNLKSSVWM